MRIICPGCRTPLQPGPRPACPVCDLVLTGPAAAELWNVDVLLLDLNRRRRALLAGLYRATPAAAPAVPTAAGGFAGRPGAAKPDASRTTARNVLLGVGGAMLGVAAVVFTVLTWTTLGPGGRALLLLGLTLLTLSAAAAVARRGLTATAETVALLGLLLVLLEAFAAHASGLAGLDRLDARWYMAGVLAAVAAGWAGYGRAVGLRLAPPAALLVAQPALPLAAAALGAGPSGAAFALLAVSAGDLAVRRAATRTATAAGLLAGFAGTALALAHASSPEPDAHWSAAALMAAAGIAAAWAHRLHPVLAALSGALPPVAVATVLPLSGRWLPAGAALAAVAALAAARLAPARLRTAASAGAAAALAGCAAWILPAAGAQALRPAARLAAPWSGTARGPGVWAADLGPWTSDAAPLVLALVLAVLLAARLRQAAPAVALLVVLTTPGLPFGVLLALVLAAAAALAGWAALDRTARPAAGAAAVIAACWGVAESLAVQEATLSVLAAVTVMAAAFATLPILRDGAASVAVLALAGEAAASCLAAGLAPRHAAFPMLAAAALGLLTASALRPSAPPATSAPPGASAPRAASASRGVFALRGAAFGIPPVPRGRAGGAVRGVPVEVSAWVAAVAGILLAAGHAAESSLALAVAGVLAFGCAVRADRRAAAWAGSALLLAAWWVRLGASGITVPEAYTLPVSAALLVIGLVRRSRGTAGNSWTAYGAGLTATLGPSLVAAWTDSGGPRPLLLGAAAAVLVLAGARARLQAPLALGAAVLLLDAARWLGPYAWEALAKLPGWVPIAALGLALLLTGATYERRLRDLRRLRDALARLG
ncbi:SCO7613 C-terminal domain-containing membrane protein [Spirillospora albida]|uniref:SCO7613 C-terminal domain-containing membrane protein n=1 Tax=Spirillospora albida TaxID=58123 RepID=UPI00068DC6B3|nr:hypothetical protein [Spirillospora albida]